MDPSFYHRLLAAVTVKCEQLQRDKLLINASYSFFICLTVIVSQHKHFTAGKLADNLTAALLSTLTET